MENYENVKIYPNPFTSSLTISSENQIYDIQIYDVIGKTILKYEELHTNNWNINTQFDSGIYYIKILTEKEIVFKKIIKN